MRARPLLLTLLLLLSGPGRSAPLPAAVRRPALRVVLQTDVYNDYLRFLHNRNPLTVHDYGGAFSRRDVIEVVLLQQALQRGGETRRMRFVLADSDSRIIKTLQEDDADVSGSSLWRSDAAAAGLPASRTLVAQGAFEAGIYMRAGNPGLAQLARHPETLRRFTAVCARSWNPDIATLRALNVNILLTENWDSMLGMLAKGRADFVLAPFQPTADFHFDAGGLRLLPVPGIKVGLAGSRHFLLGRRSDPALRQHLDEGLATMDREGLVRRAYRESGFEDVRVDAWRKLPEGSGITAALPP
jgi:hypothetical protein